MNLEERTRLAVRRVPARGLSSWLLGRRILASLFAFLAVAVSALVWVLRHGHGLEIFQLLTAFMSALGAFLLLLKQPRAARRLWQGAELRFRGDLEGASEIFFEVVDNRFVLPAMRAQSAVMLAMTATLGGHADRAIVLLRQVAASAATPRTSEAHLQACTALALLALGRAGDARAVLATGRSTDHDGARAGVELLVDALGGTVTQATAAVVRFERRRVVLRGPAWMQEMQRAYGWLVAAYVWDRAMRLLPEGDRRGAEARRAEAIARAKGVPAHFHAYLAAAYPEFDRFARDVSCDAAAR